MLMTNCSDSFPRLEHQIPSLGVTHVSQVAQVATQTGIAHVIP